MDGTLEWVDKDEAEAAMERAEMMDARALSTTPVKYYLYTNINPSKGQKLTNTAKSITGSNFNPANPTRFVIHGWTQSYTSGMNKDIRNAYLRNRDYNIIIVDWARARSVDYATSVLAVPKVGKKVASMIDYLISEHGMSLDTLEVIGHSLGAHVAGYAGKNVKSGKIPTIVGLDPALPLFSYDKPKKRLADTDAVYVESIQTNGGLLGFLKPIGKGAFYPNGGENQPGCIADLTGACSHGRSVTYYAEAVSNIEFGSIKCSSYKDAVDMNCGKSVGAVLMGATRKVDMVAGIFYVPVRNKSPFGVSPSDNIA